ncbi:MAG: TIGR03086 family metal-binding protein [Acidimicrobiales bacterium]
MTQLDLGPATQRLAALVRGVADDQLAAPTPCPAYSLGDLLDHVGGLAHAFTAAARKDTGDHASEQGASGDASRLGADWRERIPAALIALAEAWVDPAAWSGITAAGPFEMPGEQAGLIALDELVIHGWDVARSSGQPFDVDPASLDAVHGFIAQFSGLGSEQQREGRFGPVVAVPESAPLLDRVIGLAGRDPNWGPPAS